MLNANVQEMIYSILNKTQIQKAKSVLFKRSPKKENFYSQFTAEDKYEFAGFELESYASRIKT